MHDAEWQETAAHLHIGTLLPMLPDDTDMMQQLRQYSNTFLVQ